MSVGDVHNLNGYHFEETLHGPNVERTCVDCADVCYSVPDWPDPRCGRCLAINVGALPGVDRLALRDRKPKRL